MSDPGDDAPLHHRPDVEQLCPGLGPGAEGLLVAAHELGDPHSLVAAVGEKIMTAREGMG